MYFYHFAVRYPFHLIGRIFDIRQRNGITNFLDILQRLTAHAFPRSLRAVRPYILCSVITTDLSARRNNQGISRAICRIIRRVTGPSRRTEVHLPNQHTCCRDIRIPSCLLTTFDIVVQAFFSSRLFHSRCIDLVGVILLRAVRIEGQQSTVRAQVLRTDPAHEILLPHAVVRRTVTVTVITAAVHDIPFVRRQLTVVVRSVLSVIEVRQTDHVTKLMAEHTDTRARTAITLQLLRHRVVIQVLAIQFGIGFCINGVPTAINNRLNIVVMRPDRVGRTAVRFSLTGIDHIHEIHIAVIVPVVVSEIQIVILVISQNTCFNHSVCCVFVIFTYVLTVIILLFTQRHRTIYIELRLILTVRLIFEILCSRTVSAVRRAVLAGDHIFHYLCRVSGLEADIREVRQDQQSARCGVRRSTHVLAHFASLRLRTTGTRRCLTRCLTYHFEHTVLVLAYFLSVTVDHIVVVFVTKLLYLDGRAICLGTGLPSATCRHCIYRQRHTTNDCYRKYLFHFFHPFIR